MSQQLIDAVYMTLKQDAEFMAQLGLTPTSLPKEIAKRLVKGMDTDKALSSETVPQVLIYIKPGRFGRNHLVYEGKFCLDFYGKNSAEARTMGERAFKLFHDRKIVVPQFSTFLCVLSFDDDFPTGITGVKGYETIYDVDYLRMN